MCGQRHSGRVDRELELIELGMGQCGWVDQREGRVSSQGCSESIGRQETGDRREWESGGGDAKERASKRVSEGERGTQEEIESAS